MTDLTDPSSSHVPRTSTPRTRPAGLGLWLLAMAVYGAMGVVLFALLFQAMDERHDVGAICKTIGLVLGPVGILLLPAPPGSNLNRAWADVIRQLTTAIFAVLIILAVGVAVSLIRYGF
jgi:hypothetical protein